MEGFHLLLLLIIASDDASGQRKIVTPNCHTSDILETEAICNTFPQTEIPLNVQSMKVNKCDEKLTHEVMVFGSHIKKLNFSACGISVLDTPTVDSNTFVEHLDLSYNYIEAIMKSSFDENPSLKILNLNGNRIQNIENGAFINLINLEYLYLQRNQLTTIPNNLPTTLKELYLNINNIVEFDANMQQESITALYLCDNQIEHIPESAAIHLPMVEELCLGNLSISLPDNFHTYFPQLKKLYIQSSTDHYTTMKSTTVTAISQVHGLILLSITNYGIETLSFLQDLTMLTILILENVTVEGELNFDSLNDKRIDVLYLDGSPEIARQFMKNYEKLKSLMESLQTLSLRNTGITKLSENFMPTMPHFKVDISDNPLHCDCSLIEMYPDLIKLLVHTEETKCSTPEEQYITEFFESEACNTQSTEPEHEHQEYQEQSSTVYIITGTLIGVLVLVGLILCAVYWKIKKRNAVAPAETEIAQSMQQIRQASSADQLLERQSH